MDFVSPFEVYIKHTTRASVVKLSSSQVNTDLGLSPVSNVKPMSTALCLLILVNLGQVPFDLVSGMQAQLHFEKISLIG